MLEKLPVIPKVTIKYEKDHNVPDNTKKYQKPPISTINYQQYHKVKQVHPKKRADNS